MKNVAMLKWVAHGIDELLPDFFVCIGMAEVGKEQCKTFVR